LIYVLASYTAYDAVKNTVLQINAFNIKQRITIYYLLKTEKEISNSRIIVNNLIF